MVMERSHSRGGRQNSRDRINKEQYVRIKSEEKPET